MMRHVALFCVLFAAARSAAACDIALVLAIDVSGSVDAGEYRLQADGLADALADPDLRDALVQGQVALTVVAWSGAGMQVAALPWQRMLDDARVAAFARAARALPRAYRGSDTAVGEALAFAAARFDAVPDCRRRVIDISGDGPQNAGAPLSDGRSAALRAGAVLNAIAIEDPGQSIPITEFYRRNVISPGGFVVTARSHRDYPRAIRNKLLREVTRPAF